MTDITIIPSRQLAEAEVTLNSAQLRIVLRLVKYDLVKLRRKLERSTFVPAPGHVNVEELKIAQLEEAYARIRAALQETDHQRRETS